MNLDTLLKEFLNSKPEKEITINFFNYKEIDSFIELFKLQKFLTGANFLGKPKITVELENKKLFLNEIY